jgi:predicted GTPase
MSKIKELELFSKYLTKGDINTINDLTSAIQDNNIIVTCMGLYNHGKSSLLNTLIKDIEGETFKTADIRETTKNKKVRYNNITFVDTPGLNAQKNDDKRVMDAVKQSDINIFVHNVNTGEFVATEVEFFHNIINNWKNPKEFIDRTIFVLSRIDEADNDIVIKDTAIKIKQQIIDIFKVDGYVIPASSKDYIDGIVENEDELVEVSNIPMLKKCLKKLQNKLIEPIKKN